jgi:hypothetical protein
VDLEPLQACYSILRSAIDLSPVKFQLAESLHCYNVEHVHVCDNRSVMARVNGVGGVARVGTAECMVPLGSDGRAGGDGNNDVRTMGNGVRATITNYVWIQDQKGFPGGYAKLLTVRIHISNWL